MKRRLAFAAVGIVCLALPSCDYQAPLPTGPSTFHVVVNRVNGSTTLPTAAKPFPANRGDHDDTWDFTVEAVDAAGRHQDFDGVVRVTAVPGAVLNVAGDHTLGRNMQLIHGSGAGTATVTAAYGPARLWIEDIGYVPATGKTKPACSDGKDNDGDGQIDYPADPGCAYANDTTEGGGTYAAGVSNPVEYALPSVVDVQGQAAQTPYPYEAIEINTSAPHQLVVTRVSADGFFVTDLDPASVKTGYNHLFAFNFSTPSDMRPCDIVTYLSGTVNEFFGFTELNFPSYQLSFPILNKDGCKIPPAAVLDPGTILDAVAMEKVESGLVRIISCLCDSGPCDPACGGKDNGIKWVMPTKFGPGTVVNNAPTADASSCDLDGNGAVDFSNPAEASCATACDNNAECSEWTSFSARGELKVHAVGTMSGVIQINTSTATEFDPTANRGKTLDSVTGTLRDFSGGSLNWTIETRCSDDLVCKGTGCVPKALPSTKACISLRTINDNNAGTN